MKQRFYSKKDQWISVVFFISAVLPVGIIGMVMAKPEVKPMPQSAIIILYAVTLSVCSLLISFWFQTYYEIDETWLYHRMGPIKGKILIKDIREIKRNARKTAYSPSLSMKLILVKYGENSGITLSPEDEDGFINMLKRINPKIVVD